MTLCPGYPRHGGLRQVQGVKLMAYAYPCLAFEEHADAAAGGL